MARRSAQLIVLRRRPAGVSRIERLGIEAQVPENPLDHGRLLDARDHLELPAAAPADLDVDGEHPLQALCPGQRPLPVAGSSLAAPVGLFRTGYWRALLVLASARLSE